MAYSLHPSSIYLQHTQCLFLIFQVTACNLVDSYQRFGKACCLYLRGERDIKLMPTIFISVPNQEVERMWADGQNSGRENKYKNVSKTVQKKKLPHKVNRLETEL
jgi:hypothetical protein